MDPDSWVTYYKMIGNVLDNPAAAALTEEQVKLAWQYAYSFFFDYARPFPWHLVKMWDDYEKRPMSYVLSQQGQDEFGRSFEYMIGKPLDWKEIFASKDEDGTAG